ncbi:MAG: transketolase, partial [Victivallaceae bacterium]
MRKCFKDTILKLAENDPELVMLMGDISVFLFREFYEKYPDRFFNAGIAENTEVSMAAAMSLEGFHPFVHTIAPFVTER